MLKLSQGKKLIELARKTVEKHFGKNELFLEKSREEIFNEKKGVFVTIENYPQKSLRGCIGFPLPKIPLYEAVKRATISSAFEDPRFSPLTKEELKKITFEISVLTKPELIEIKTPKDAYEKIKIGKDGLILQNGPFSGLLLPQVPIEFNWDVDEFLENLAYKSGLTPDYVYHRSTKLWKFQAQIFSEKSPAGEVIEIIY